jgi:hypothetical protein
MHLLAKERQKRHETSIYWIIIKHDKLCWQVMRPNLRKWWQWWVTIQYWNDTLKIMLILWLLEIKTDFWLFVVPFNPTPVLCQSYLNSTNQFNCSYYYELFFFLYKTHSKEKMWWKYEYGLQRSEFLLLRYWLCEIFLWTVLLSLVTRIVTMPLCLHIILQCKGMRHKCSCHNLQAVPCLPWTRVTMMFLFCLLSLFCWSKLHNPLLHSHH